MNTIPLEEAVEKMRLYNAFEEGMEKGMEKGKATMAKKLIAAGIPAEVVAKTSGLPIEKIMSFQD